ncbi:hypothetical protein [Chryseobacterium piperi]|nr:hypothetical protein [Chryseobacterium piperi]
MLFLHLAGMKVGGVSAAAPLQQIDYAYNITYAEVNIKSCKVIEVSHGK